MRLDGLVIICNKLLVNLIVKISKSKKNKNVIKRFSIFLLTAALVLVGTTIFAFMHHEDGARKIIKFSLIDQNIVAITEKEF